MKHFLTLICSTSSGTVSPFRMDSVADVTSLKNTQGQKISLKPYFTANFCFVYQSLTLRCPEMNFFFPFLRSSTLNRAFPKMPASHFSCFCWQPIEKHFLKHQSNLKTSIHTCCGTIQVFIFYVTLNVFVCWNEGEDLYKPSGLLFFPAQSIQILLYNVFIISFVQIN